MTKKAAQSTPNHLLRMARLERGWTQKDVADRIGAPLDLNVTRWERGTARPSAYYVQKLCELFGKSASELGLLPPQPEEAAANSKPNRAEPGHPSKDLPTGTLTMLFTDMAESTRLLQQLGDRYASLLADYRQIVRAAFRQWHGYEVNAQSDAFFVVFARANDAAAAAVAIQRALAAHNWIENVVVLARIGLHTGEPQLTSEGYVGLDVDHTERIMNAGHAGQILLSQTTHNLVEHALPGDMSLQDLGEHRLKDLQRPSHLFQLGSVDLPADFPPLKTLDLRPNNLPMQPTPFIGREREVARVEAIPPTSQPARGTNPARAADSPPTQAPASQASTNGKASYRGIEGLPPPTDSRTIQQREKVVREVYNKLLQPGITAIALTGIGGAGKSTLAALISRYAEEQHRTVDGPSFDEPIWLTINDSTTMMDLAGSLFEALNRPVPDLGSLTPQSQAVALFKALNTVERPRLVILDQFENLLDWQTGHALEERPGVGEWLDAINSQQCRCRILLTSRPWPKGTREYPPTYMQEYRVKGFELAEGSELLRKQGIEAKETELRTAVERCQGHAFSLTLLASLLRDYNLNLSLLFKDQKYAQIWTGNVAHNLLDRIYTQKLDAVQRKLLTAFSVYREPIPLEAALAVMDAGTQALQRQVLPALYTLLAQHLLQAMGEGRYQLHAIISSYVQDHFVENDEQANLQSLRTAHGKAAQYYMRLAAASCPPREKRQQTGDVQPLIEAIWNFCQAEQCEQAFDLMQQEYIFDDLIRWGGHASLLEIYQLLLSSETWQMKPSQAACIYNSLGEVYRVLGQMERAIEHYELSLPIYQQIKDRSGEGWVLNNLGRAYNPLGKKEQARHYLEQAVEVLREAGDHGGEGTALCNLGWTYYDQGQMKRAQEYFEQALKVLEKAGDHLEGKTLYSIGRIYADLGALKQARAYYERALAVYRAAGERAGEGLVLSSLGRLYTVPEQKEEALRYSEQALRILKEAGDRSAEGWAFKCLGRIYHDLGEYKQAQQFYEQALAILREVEDHRGEGRVLDNLGRVYDVQGQKEKALKYYVQSLHILGEIGDRWGEGKTMWNISRFYFKHHIYDIALACLLVTANIFNEVQSPEYDQVASYIDRLHEEIGEEHFVALLGEVKPQVQQIVEQALREKTQ